MSKSPEAKGKRQGNANVKKYFVVNSEIGSVPCFGHGIMTVPLLSCVTSPGFSTIL